MFRRAAACDTIRIGTPPSAPSSSADERRVVLQPVADRADDRHVVFARDFGDVLQRLDDLRQPARVVDRHRDADFRRRDDVDRRPMRSNTSKMRRRKPCAISMRVDVMSTTVTPFFDATAVSGRPRRRAVARDERAVASCGRRELRIRTGNVLRRPPAESSPGAAPSRRSTPAPTLRRTTGAARPARRCTMRGSAVSMPSTSVQI